MAYVMTTSGYEYDISELHDPSFYINHVLDLDIGCPVQADPILYKLDEFPEFKNAKQLYVKLLGHTTYDRQWTEPYGLVPVSKLESVKISARAWYDELTNEWMIRLQATKNLDYEGEYPTNVILKVQLYTSMDNVS